LIIEDILQTNLTSTLYKFPSEARRKYERM